MADLGERNLTRSVENVPQETPFVVGAVTDEIPDTSGEMFQGASGTFHLDKGFEHNR